MKTPSGTFFLSTPIYYVNAAPHLGHAYTSTIVDARIRMARLSGEEAFFLTGTDEHGDKIVKAAESRGMEPKAFCDLVSEQFRQLLPILEVEPSKFIRTTDPEHIKTVQEALLKVYESGDIYFGEYGGHYCVGCERFYTEKELMDGLCPDHLVKPEFISEKNYFFRMSKYQGWLAEHILKNPDFIRPEGYRMEVLSLLESGALEDLCISRPKKRLSWGVELPFDRDYVAYVWFDALINYISALNWPNGPKFAKFWPHAEHVTAKDILKPHAIFWPTMLKALGLEPYQRLNVHGYWLVRETKMSKSLGNVIDPVAYAKAYGAAAFRYFLLREMAFGRDASFSQEALISRVNSDLANNLGNLFSRTLALTVKYAQGKVPTPGALGPDEEEVIAISESSLLNFRQFFEKMQFSRALEELWRLVDALNRYVDRKAPWLLGKEGRTEELGTTLYFTLEGLRKVAVHLWPVMPSMSQEMCRRLGYKFNPKEFSLKNEDTEFGELHPGEQVFGGENLFPRIDKPRIKEKVSQKIQESSAPETDAQEVKEVAEPVMELVEIDDFKKLDLRIGTIISAEPVKDADKLLSIFLDVGEDEPREVLAGLAEHYKPDELVGRQVTVLCNLKPRKMRGKISNGMILAVRSQAGMRLLQPSEPPVDNGSPVS